MIWRPLPPSFLIMYNLSMPSLACKDLCIIIIISSPFVELLPSFTLRLVPSRFKGRNPRYLSPRLNFRYIVWFWIVFLAFLRYYIFLSSPIVWNFRLPILRRNPCVLIFSWFGTSFPFIICRFYFSLLEWHILLCRIAFLYPDCIFSLPVLASFSFLATSLMSSMYIWLWFFSCNSWSLQQPVHFLCMWLSGITGFNIF